MRLACFVTPHGYGHATRARAVLDALCARGGPIDIELYSSVPQWLFAGIEGRLNFHRCETDLGLVQKDALRVDPDRSLEALSGMLPFDAALVDDLAEDVVSRGCRVVLCDVSALGLAVAARARLPSVLVDNFTWDWIYRRLDDDRFEPHADYLEAWYRQAGLRVRTRPFCGDIPADLVVDPLCRAPRAGRDALRRSLGVDASTPLVLVTMGGMPQEYPFLERLRNRSGVRFLFAGHRRGFRDGNIEVLASGEGLDHPGLVAAADVLIGKIGYSTLAEAYNAGTPFGCFTRPGYPEMPPLEDFIGAHMPSLIFDAGQFYDGSWLARLDDLLAMPRAVRERSTAAAEVAELLAQCARDDAGGA